MAEFQIYYGTAEIDVINQGTMLLAALNLAIISTLLIYSYKESREADPHERQ